MIVAILLAVLGTSSINFGFLLQKSKADSITFSAKEPLTSILSILNQKLWLFGFFLTAIGWVFFLFAYSLAPVSIIAPLNNVGILVLVGVAVFWLKEKLSSFEWLGIIIVFLGIIIVSFSSIASETQEIAFERLSLVLTTLICLILLSTTLIFPYIFNKRSSGIFYSIASGIAGGLAAIFTKILTIVLTDLNELIIFAAIFLFFQTLSFLTLQAGFQEERAMITIPLFNSFSTIVPILGGIFIFLETLNVFQILGILFMLLGSSALFNFSTPSKEKESIEVL